MEFRGSHYAYRGSDESVYGQNLTMDQTGHHRQPSYLAAIDIARPTDTVEPIQDFIPFCSSGVSKGTGDQNVDRIENCGRSAEHYGQITSCREKFPSSDAGNRSVTETHSRYGNVKGHIGGFKGVGDFGKVSQMHGQLAVEHLNKELHLNYFNSMKAGNMGHRPRHDVMSVPSQNAKNIPRAVVAPITRCSMNYNHSESDRFLSLPKTVKLVGSRSDTNRNEAVHSSKYPELFSFESDNARKVTDLHSKVWSDMNHPDHAKPQQRNQVRQAELSSYDGSDNAFDYIHPQKVEQVLSLQRSRKMSSSCGRKNSISDVTGQISVSAVAAVMPVCSINARKLPARSCHETVDRLSDVSLAVPCYTTHEVDRISTSSSSSTKRSSVDSHCDSGYSGSRHSDSLKSSCSQSPELCASSSAFQQPSGTRKHFIREQNPAAGLTIARSVSYQGDSVRHPNYAESVGPPFSWEEGNSNAHSCERNQTVNISNMMSKTNDKHRAIANEMKSKQSYHNKHEDMKYLQMLNRQIKLYREKDGETVKNYCHPVVENIPDVQTRRDRVFSSCGSIEKCLPGSNLVATNSKVKVPGSTDFSDHILHYKEVGDGMDHLISRKKTLKLNQIGRGVGDKIQYNPGTLKLKNLSVRNDRQASGHSSSGKTVNNLEVWSENSSTCGSCDDESSLSLNNRKATIGNPCSFTWENSAEDIISAWTSMKEGKKR